MMASLVMGSCMFFSSVIRPLTLSRLPLNPLLMGMTSGCTTSPCAWLPVCGYWTAPWVPEDS